MTEVVETPERSFDWAVGVMDGFNHPSVAGFWVTLRDEAQGMVSTIESLKKSTVSEAQVGEFIKNADESSTVGQGWVKLQALREQARVLEAELKKEVRNEIAPGVSEEERDNAKAYVTATRDKLGTFGDVLNKLVLPYLDQWVKSFSGDERKAAKDYAELVTEAAPFFLSGGKMPSLKGVGSASANGTPTKAKNPDAPLIRKWLKESYYADGSKVIADMGRIDADDKAAYYAAKEAGQLAPEFVAA